MRLLIISCLLFAMSMAQTAPDGFCVEWSQCQPSYCQQAEKDYCPCTCAPATINSDPSHFISTFGTSDAAGDSTGTGADSTPVDSTDGTAITDGDVPANGGDIIGAGGGGDAASAPPQVSWTVRRTGYVCEEQDLELMHFHLGMFTTVRKCAETVAATPVCGPTFFAGPISGNCGCVKRGFECAENEADDRLVDVNIYILNGGGGMFPPGMGPMGGMPGAGNPGAGMPAGFPAFASGMEMEGWPPFSPFFQHYKRSKTDTTSEPSSRSAASAEPALRQKQIMMHPEYEAPEPEDLLPGLFQGMMQGGPGFGQMQGGGISPFLSKAAPKKTQTVEDSTPKGHSTLTLTLCAVIPALVGFLAGVAIFRWKSSANSDLTQRMTV